MVRFRYIEPWVQFSLCVRQLRQLHTVCGCSENNLTKRALDGGGGGRLCEGEIIASGYNGESLSLLSLYVCVGRGGPLQQQGVRQKQLDVGCEKCS